MKTSVMTLNVTSESITQNIAKSTPLLIGRYELIDAIRESEGFAAFVLTTFLNILKNGKEAVTGGLALAYEFGYLHGAKDAGHPVSFTGEVDPNIALAHKQVQEFIVRHPDVPTVDVPPVGDEGPQQFARGIEQFPDTFSGCE